MHLQIFRCSSPPPPRRRACPYQHRSVCRSLPTGQGHDGNPPSVCKRTTQSEGAAYPTSSLSFSMLGHTPRTGEQTLVPAIVRSSVRGTPEQAKRTPGGDCSPEFGNFLSHINLLY